MSDELSPAAIAQGKRETILGVGDQEFMLWQHNPITAAYFQYLEDLIAYYREAAMDMLEAGQLVPGDQHQDRNPESLRGQIVMLRQLHQIDIGAIHRFYGKESPEVQESQA